jgi:glutamine amidotransferase
MLVVVDYGVGNQGSVLNMYRRLGIEAVRGAAAADIAAAGRLVLPGIGAFDHCMIRLRDAGLEAPLRAAIARGVPLLGICVGMQMLLEGSEEGGQPGLGLIPGRAVRFATQDAGLKVPHMGWNRVQWCADDVLNEDLRDEARFYFVHSYHAVCADREAVLGTTTYGGEFASAIRSGRVYGVQFHPEKSHRFGLALLRNFSRA